MKRKYLLLTPTSPYSTECNVLQFDSPQDLMNHILEHGGAKSAIVAQKLHFACHLRDCEPQEADDF